MPVNHGLKVIFIHIPKTAGTAVEHALGMHGELSDIGIERYLNQEMNYNLLFGGGLQHFNARLIRKYLGKNRFDEYYKFTIVRNPYDRLVSFVGSRNGKWHKKEKLSKEQFIDHLKQSQRIFKSGSAPLPRSQYEYVTFKGKLVVNSVLHFENLNNEIDDLSSELKFEIKLEHRMKSYHDDYRFYYDEYSKKLVRKIYKKDFDYFGYDSNNI
jgi:hypothetical protein